MRKTAVFHEKDKIINYMVRPHNIYRLEGQSLIYPIFASFFSSFFSLQLTSSSITLWNVEAHTYPDSSPVSRDKFPAVICFISFCRLYSDQVTYFNVSLIVCLCFGRNIATRQRNVPLKSGKIFIFE